jgi:hypothetical protein
MPQAETSSITTSPPPHTVTALIRKYRKLHKIARILDHDVIDNLYEDAADLRFDIVSAPSRNIWELGQKIEFFHRDHFDVGPNGDLETAARAGIRADLQRLGGVHA